MNHYYFIFAFFVSFFSQSQSFKGKVVSSENKSISDVYVLNLNNQSHAHSNYKGEFTLENTVSGDSISISHKSFEELRTVISENNSFILNTKPVSLREVVITNELNHLYEIAKKHCGNQPECAANDWRYRRRSADCPPASPGFPTKAPAPAVRCQTACA